MEPAHEADARAGDREQPQLHGEHQDQHEPDPEGGETEPNGRERADDRVGPAPTVARRGDRQRHREQHAEHDAVGDQEGGGGDAGGDQVAHGDAVDDRMAELALEEAAQVEDVLHPDRPVETVVGADALHHLGRRAEADERADRIPRQRLEQQERHEADAEEHEHQLQRTPQDEAVPAHPPPGHRFAGVGRPRGTRVTRRPAARVARPAGARPRCPCRREAAAGRRRVGRSASTRWAVRPRPARHRWTRWAAR
jgi:hypothetical protein